MLPHPVIQLAAAVPQTRPILPVVHALTCCDSTSSLSWIGKITAMKVVEDNVDEVQQLVILGADDTSIDDAVNVSRKFVAKLYDVKGKYKQSHTNLNKLRTKHAAKKTMSLKRLPPSEPSFVQHVKCATWQTKAHVALPHLGEPLDYGWKQEPVIGLGPITFDMPSAADVNSNMLCSCKEKEKCQGSCSCYENKLACTDLCPCNGEDGCLNILTHRNESDAEDEDQD